MDRWQLERAIIERAFQDKKFLKKLRENPKQAILEHFNDKIDARYKANMNNININIHQEKENEWQISLPNQLLENRHLSVEELKTTSAAGDCLGSYSC